MSSFGLLLRRELGYYFVSPVAYVLFIIFLALVGLNFVSTLASFEQSRLPIEFSANLQMVVFFVAIFCPLITMRLIAEEKGRGTIETIMTTPVTEPQFVLAKYFATIVLLNYLIVIPVFGYALLLSFHTSVDPGIVFTSWLGILLAGSVIFSIGLLISSLCTNQITAVVITLGVVILLIIARILIIFGIARDTFWHAVVLRIDLMGGVNAFFQGVLDTRDIVYYLSVTAFFIFLTVRVVESRRWR